MTSSQQQLIVALKYKIGSRLPLLNSLVALINALVEEICRSFAFLHLQMVKCIHNDLEVPIRLMHLIPWQLQRFSMFTMDEIKQLFSLLLLNLYCYRKRGNPSKMQSEQVLVGRFATRKMMLCYPTKASSQSTSMVRGTSSPSSDHDDLWSITQMSDAIKAIAFIIERAGRTSSQFANFDQRMERRSQRSPIPYRGAPVVTPHC
jgi:hypothetical protein